jgi:hypothetical protein
LRTVIKNAVEVASPEVAAGGVAGIGNLLESRDKFWELNGTRYQERPGRLMPKPGVVPMRCCRSEEVWCNGVGEPILK